MWVRVRVWVWVRLFIPGVAFRVSFFGARAGAKRPYTDKAILPRDD